MGVRTIREQIEQQAQTGLGPAEFFRLKTFGPRTAAASSQKAFLLFGCAVVALALNQQCTSREWAKYAQMNGRPHLVYLDPTGNAYLVSEGQDTKPVVSEDVIRHFVTRLTEMQFQVFVDQAGKDTSNLVDYFYDGDALIRLNQSADRADVLGSAAEKATLIAAGKKREIEIRSIRLPEISDLPSGAQKVHAEVLFYARTYKRGVDEPELRRAYRLDWYFIVLGEIKGKNPAARTLFEQNNPIRLRVQDYKFVEEYVGVVPLGASNQGPNPGPQSEAQGPDGSMPRPAAADFGGPAAPLISNPGQTSQTTAQSEIRR
jgi:hypothetical protein